MAVNGSIRHHAGIPRVNSCSSNGSQMSTLFPGRPVGGNILLQGRAQKPSASTRSRNWSKDARNWSLDNSFPEEQEYGEFECLALHISPELGERLMVSGERSLIEEVFPEISQTLMDARSGVAWNQDAKHVIRFPLNGYCKLISLQAIARLLSHGFRIAASNGGGVEGQQFSEYLFVRRSPPQ